MGARLPPVPPSLLQEGYHQRPEAIISPKPQVPPVTSARTTKALEYQASVVGKQQQQQGDTMNPADARIANWVANTSAGQEPPNRTGTPYLGPAPGQAGIQPHPQGAAARYGSPMPGSYHVSPMPNGRGTPPGSNYAPAPPAGYAGGPPPRLRLNQSADMQPQQQPPSPSLGPMHPPRASSMMGMSTAYSNAPAGGGSYPSYDPQYDRRLHHSFSELNLDTSGNKYLADNRSNGYPQQPLQNSNLGASTSRLNPADNRYRTTSMISGPSGPPSGAYNLNASTSRPLSSSTSGHTRPMSASDATLAHSMSATSISATNSALCIALPSQAELAQQREAAQFAPNPAAARVSWAKSVLKFVERHQASSAGGEFSKITDPTLVKWTDESIRLILSLADNVASPVSEALYLRGELSSSGKFPSYRSKDLSMAFRDFETAANLGYHAAWAKIALAYETYGEQNKSQADFDRAKRAYDEGVQKNEVTCTYVSGTSKQ